MVESCVCGFECPKDYDSCGQHCSHFNVKGEGIEKCHLHKLQHKFYTKNEKDKEFIIKLAGDLQTYHGKSLKVELKLSDIFCGHSSAREQTFSYVRVGFFAVFQDVCDYLSKYRAFYDDLEIRLTEIKIVEAV